MGLSLFVLAEALREKISPSSLYMKRREKTSYMILKVVNHVKDIKKLGSWKLRKRRFLERVGMLSVPSYLQREGVRIHLPSLRERLEGDDLESLITDPCHLRTASDACLKNLELEIDWQLL